MIDYTVSCNLCGYSEFEVIEKDQAPYKVLKCKNCSLIFVYPHPDNTSLKKHYNIDYYSEWIDVQKEGRIRMWNKRLKMLYSFQSGGKILDVGCGEGLFLKLAQNEGWNVYGTEMSSYGAKYASHILGTDIFCGELTEAGYSDNSFDAVTMWHVLEHVADPYRYLSEIYRILRPKGSLVIAVPNVNNAVMQIAYRIIKRRKLKLYTKDEKELHLYHFSPKTIKTYLKKTGFDCLKISPDFGIIEHSKKIINIISIIPYYIAGIHVYNAIEVFAIPKKA